MRNLQRGKDPAWSRKPASATAASPGACSTLVALVIGTLSPCASAADYSWTTGDFVPGVTAPSPLPAGDRLLIGSGANKRFSAVSFANAGEVLWQADTLQGANGASVLNQSLWDSSSDANAFSHTMGARPTFTNSGTFRKSAGNGSTTIADWAFLNAGGTIDAQTGTILFSSSSNTFEAESRFQGAGVVRIAGSALFNGVFRSDNLQLASGTYTGAAATFASGAAVASGQVRWAGGNLAGTWTFHAGNTLLASGSEIKRQVGGSITNAGTVLWDTTANFEGGSGGDFINDGLFEARQSASIVHVLANRNSFVNGASGVVRAANGADLTIGGVSLLSTGGEFNAHAGSTILYAGGEARFNDGTRFTGAGSHVVNGSATYVGSFYAGNVTFSAGSLRGGDGTPGSKATLQGTVSWTGGGLQGNWEIAAGSTVTASGAGDKQQLGSTVVNHGTLIWAADAALQGGSGAELINNGVVDIASDADLTHNFGAKNALVNNGLLRKSAGNGETSLADIDLSNPGTIEVLAGSIRLPANFVNAGTLAGTAGFAVGGTLRNAGRVAPGASPGTLTIDGGFLQTAAGLLDMEIGSFSVHDMLLINGSATVDGTLALHCFADCFLDVGEIIPILDASGTVSGNFTTVTMTGFARGRFEPVPDFGNGRILLNVVEATAPIPEPETYALMLAGLGVVAWAVRRRRTASCGQR